MSEPSESIQPIDPMRKLSEAIRDVKNASADRDDVVVEMREAQRGRLELLAAELEAVFSDVPKDDAQFDFAISSGLQPRLWIDATSHVAMGRDRRVYRFVRDTRMGRVVLAESHDFKVVAAQVTRYIAERIVERQRLMDGDVEPAFAGRTASLPPSSASKARAGTLGEFMAGLGLVIAGAVAGALVLLAMFWEKLVALGAP